MAGCGEGSPNENDIQERAVWELRSDAERVVPEVAEAKAAAAGEQAFAFDVLRLLSAEQNLAFSPHSVSTALAMLAGAAEGETLGELEQALSFSPVNEEFHRSQDALLLALAARNREASDDADAQIFSEANDVWVTDQVAPSSPYLDALARYYGAGVHQAKFGSAPEPARQSINARVSELTRRLIPELLPEGSIDPLTILVLTNALYFKAPWVESLVETGPASFEHLDGTVSQVPMLSTSARLDYAEGEDFLSVALPYFGSELELLIVLPAAGSYDQVRSALSAQTFGDLVERRTPRAVHLSLPEFEIRSTIPIRETLGALGVERLFDARAELPLLPFAEGAHVTDIFHQATVAVDAHGTEASAATAVVVGRKGGDASPDDSIQVTVDRPFLFAIRDIETSAALFVGQVVAP